MFQILRHCISLSWSEIFLQFVSVELLFIVFSYLCLNEGTVPKSKVLSVHVTAVFQSSLQSHPIRKGLILQDDTCSSSLFVNHEQLCFSRNYRNTVVVCVDDLIFVQKETKKKHPTNVFTLLSLISQSKTLVYPYISRESATRAE